MVLFIAKADFIGAMPENGPVIVSVMKEVEKLDTRVGYRILVRTRTVRCYYYLYSVFCIYTFIRGTSAHSCWQTR